MTNPKLKRDNRCCACNKFKGWADLKVSVHIPDSEFTTEHTEYLCTECSEKDKAERRKILDEIVTLEQDEFLYEDTSERRTFNSHEEMMKWLEIE